MATTDSERTARELVDRLNREIASGGTGDQTRELAREIGGEQLRQDEAVARRRTGTSPRPIQTRPQPVSVPERIEVTVTREGALPTSEARDVIERSRLERVAAQQRDDIFSSIQDRGLTEDRLARAYEAELLRQRREQDFGDLTDEDRALARRQAEEDVARQRVREQVAEQVVSDVEPGLRRERPDLFGVQSIGRSEVIGGQVSPDTSPSFDVTRPSQFFFDLASRARRRGFVAEQSGSPVRAAGFGARAFGFSLAASALFVPEFAVRTFGRSTVGDFARLPSALVSSLGEIGPSLRTSPITTGSEIASGVGLPGLAVRVGERASAVLATFRSDFIPVTTVTTGRSFRVDRGGVTFRPQVTEQVLFNVPVDTGTQTLILRGGVASTAEDLATQVARGGAVGQPVSAQVGLVPFGVQEGRVPLRFVPGTTDIELAFFVDPASRVRLTRAGLGQDVPSPLVSSDVRFTLFSTRPQVIGFGDQRFASFPSDIQSFITRDPTGRTWTAAERARLQSFQLSQTGDRFTVPGKVSIESEAITTASALDVTRVGTTVIDGRRVALFSAELVPQVSATPSPTLVSRGGAVTSADTAFLPVGTTAFRFVGVGGSGGVVAGSGRGFLEGVSTTVSSQPFRSDLRALNILSTSDTISSDLIVSSQSVGVTSDFTGGSRVTSPSRSVSSPSLPPRTPTTPSLPSPISQPPRTPGITRGPPFIPRRPSVPVRPPTTSLPPPLPPSFDDDSDRPRRRRRDEDEFLVEVRRGGEFRPIGAASTREAAISLGVGKVERTLAASFRVRTSRGDIVDVSDIDRFTAGRFRPGVSDTGLAVERRRFRLGTGSEVREIQSSRRRFGGV